MRLADKKNQTSGQNKCYHGASTNLNVLQNCSHGVVNLGLHGHAIGDNNTTKSQNMSEGLDAVATSTVNNDVDGVTTNESLEIGTPFFYSRRVSKMSTLLFKNARRQ